MFGLASDMQDDKWEDMVDEQPPANKKTWKGYTHYNVSRYESNEEYIRFFLQSDRGDPVQGLLYGANRNPLKDVIHCYMSIEEDLKVGNVIKAVAVEDDWIVMKPEYFNQFQRKTAEDIAKEKAEDEAKRKFGSFCHGDKLQSTVFGTNDKIPDVGLYGDLQSDKWMKRKDEIPRLKKAHKYDFYEVLRVEQDGTSATQFKVFLCSSSGNQMKALLKYTLRNALNSITRGYFKIETIEKDKVIKGIMIEKEWVEMIPKF